MSEFLSQMPLPSDFLIENYKTLQRRNDFEDLIEDLDDLQEQAIQEAFQAGVNHGQDITIKNILELHPTIEI